MPPLPARTSMRRTMPRAGRGGHLDAVALGAVMLDGLGQIDRVGFDGHANRLNRPSGPAAENHPQAESRQADARRRCAKSFVASHERRPASTRSINGRRLALEQREQNMIAPCVVDLEIGARKPFAMEAVALQQRDRRRVVGNAGRFDAMQAQRREAESDDRGDRARHVSLSGVRRAHPIAERRRLRDAAADAAEREPAEQFVRRRVEDEEGVGFVARHFLRLAAQAPAEGGAGEVVLRPGRLPGRQERAALLAQPRPRGIVRADRRTQMTPSPRNSGSGSRGLVRRKSAMSGPQPPLRRRATPARSSALPTPPIAATVGGDLSMAAPALRTSSTVTASIRAEHFFERERAPVDEHLARKLLGRALGNSRAVKVETFICALARRISFSPRRARRLARQSSEAAITSPASLSAAPA